VNLSTSHTLLAFILDTAVARVNALVRLCVTPVAQPHGSVPAVGGERHCLATVAVTQPVRVSSEGSGSCRQLRVWPLEQPKDLSGGLGTPYMVPYTLYHSKPTLNTHASYTVAM